MGRINSEDHHPNHEARRWQHHIVGCFVPEGTDALSQNRWHRDEGRLCGYIEAISQDISQEIKTWTQMDNNPRHT